MSYLFLEYPKCNTCRNAKKWLDEHKITYEDRHIIDRNPSVEELTEWIKRSKLPLKNFFNTSGLVYKEMKLKDKLPAMSEAEQIALLASDGKLIKRPLLISENQVLVGFKADEGLRPGKKKKPPSHSADRATSVRVLPPGKHEIIDAGQFPTSACTLVDEFLLPEYPERYVAYPGIVVL